MFKFRSVRRHSLLAALLLAAVATASTSAHAADRETKSLTVNYGDLNLASKAGQEALRQRLVMASRRVCGDSSLELAESADEVACRNQALGEAMASMRTVVAAAQARSNVALASANLH